MIIALLNSLQLLLCLWLAQLSLVGFLVSFGITYRGISVFEALLHRGSYPLNLHLISPDTHLSRAPTEIIMPRWSVCMHPPLPIVLSPSATQACGGDRHLCVFFVVTRLLQLAQLQKKPHSSAMENAGHGQSEGQKETMNTGVNPLALFDKCHGLLYVPTGTRGRRLNVPSEGRGGELIHDASTHLVTHPSTGLA